MMENAPSPPPRRKNHKSIASYGAGSGHNVARAMVPVDPPQSYSLLESRSPTNGSYKITNKTPKNIPGTNSARFLNNETPNSNTYDDGGLESPTNRSVRKEKQQKSFKKKASPVCVIDGTPDAVIGEDVEMNGEFQFDRFLRIDGKFQGTLFSESKGDLIVGRKGCIIGDVIIARKMIVEGGHIAGKLVVDELLLLDHSVIKGDITCKAIEITGSSVTIAGRANVHPLAPELIDEHGNIISEIPKKVKKPNANMHVSLHRRNSNDKIYSSRDPLPIIKPKDRDNNPSEIYRKGTRDKQSMKRPDPIHIPVLNSDIVDPKQEALDRMQERNQVDGISSPSPSPSPTDPTEDNITQALSPSQKLFSNAPVRNFGSIKHIPRVNIIEEGLDELHPEDAHPDEPFPTLKSRKEAKALKSPIPAVDMSIKNSLPSNSSSASSKERHSNFNFDTTTTTTTTTGKHEHGTTHPLVPVSPLRPIKIDG